MISVWLEGGPADGQVVEVEDHRSSLLVQGFGIPDGMVARYRPTRRKTDGGMRILTFKEYDKIVWTRSRES